MQGFIKLFRIIGLQSPLIFLQYKALYFSDKCRKFDKYVNKTANACGICEQKFSSLRNVFLHVQMKHPLLNEFDEIDIDEESMIENHNIVTPNLGPGMISAGQNPDLARYVYYYYLLGYL